MENLYKDFIKKDNWYYKQISTNFYLIFGWLQNIPAGENYYDLPFNTNSSHINSIVLTAPTGTSGVKTATAYIRNKKIYIYNQNSNSENFSIMAIVQI